VKRKFTSFVKSAVVDFGDREAPTYPEGNIVEVGHPLVPFMRKILINSGILRT